MTFLKRTQQRYSAYFKHSLRTNLLLIASLLLIPSAQATAAADFPSQPVKLVVAFSPGTGTDIWARMVAPRLESLWGQPVVVENRPGAGGLIGTSHVVRSKPDGHTLLVSSLSSAMAKLTSANANFDPQKDLTPVVKFINYEMFIATNAQTYETVKSLGDLIAQGDKVEGGVFFGGTGPSSSFNVCNAIVMSALGLKYTAVDFSGVTQFLHGLLRNDVQYVWSTPAALKTHIDQKTIVPLAVVGESRYNDWPEVPTVREAGLTGYIPYLWGGIHAPGDTPKPIVDKISKDIRSVILEPEMKQRIERTIGGTVPDSTPAAFAQEIDADIQAWQEYFTKIGFEPQ